MTKQQFHSILWILGICLLFLLRYGYEFGRNDHAELLTYIHRLAHPESFPKDLYVNALSKIFPNERSIYAALLLLGESWGLEKWVFLLHFTSLFALVAGMWAISGLWIKENFWRFVAVLMPLTLLYGIHLGGNELTYNGFYNSNLAKAIAIWGLYAQFRGKWIWANFLFLLAGSIHVLVGLQLLLVANFACFFSVCLQEKKLFWKREFTVGAASLFLILAYMLLIRSAYHGGTSNTEGSEVMDIIYKFRAPHHYIPSAWKLSSWGILLSFCAVSLRFFWENLAIRLWLGAIFAGMLVFVLGVEVFSLTPVATTQWFKLTIWVKFLGMIALCAWLEQKIKIPNFFHAAYFIPIPILAAFLGLKLNLWTANFDFPWQKNSSDSVLIGEKAEKLLPADAVLVYPPRENDFIWYARRSRYIDYKANLHEAIFAKEWARRIAVIYGVKYKPAPRNWLPEAENFYKNVSCEQLALWKKEGITHALWRQKKSCPALEEIAVSGEYHLYRLMP